MTGVDEQVQKWRGWIDGPIHNDITDLHHKRQVWREVGEMLGANSAVARTPSAFWDWMSDNYVTALAVGVRRQADRDRRSSSLARLIEEMRDDAPRLTRTYFLSLWREPGDPRLMRRAHAAFDALAGAGRADLDLLGR